jgi:hypothetical protein
MDNSSQALRAAWESARDRCDVDFEDFAMAVEDWNVHPVRVAGKIVGAILTHREQIHACIKPEAFGKWVGMKEVNVLNDVIDRYGRAVTSVSHGNEVGRKFVQGLGFSLVEIRNGVDWFELDRKYGH